MAAQMIGFVGVGRMGGPMAARLLDAGHSLTIFDTSAEALAPLKARGATVAASAHEVANSAEVVMMRRQSHDRVRDMLQRLPEDQREVIILRHYADMSFKEIAATTNCSINTALGRMRYGLINLRKLMVQKQIAL